MTRYTINIGDDFPLGDDDKPGQHDSRWSRGRRGFRAGTVLRVLFVLAIAAIVIAHPVKVALIVGLILLLRRSPRFAEFRDHVRDAARRAWPETVGKADAWVRRNRGCVEQKREEIRERNYRGFV